MTARFVLQPCVRGRGWMALLFVVVAWGCKSKPAAPQALKTAPPPVTSQTHKRGAASPNADAEVKGAIATWVVAQNDGDFAGYERAYAAKFYGVKRSGPRVHRFNRSGWMADRKRMFAKPMKVSYIADHVSVSGSVAFVEGVQTWASGRYKDEGRKRLLMHREAGEWRIANEEMLQSKVDVAPEEGGLNYIAVYEGHPIFDADAPEAWAEEESFLDGYSVTRVVATDRLPPKISQWQGKTLRIYDKQGNFCTATVTGFQMRATADWHFGSTQSWDSGDVPEEDMIAEIWRDGVHLLEGVIDSKDGNCEEGHVAFDAAFPELMVIPFRLLGEDEKARFIRAATTHLQVGESIEQAEVYVAQLQAKDVSGATQYTYVVSSAEPCTSEQIGVDAAFLWRGTWGRPTREYVGQMNEQGPTPLLLLDVDKDGKFEVLFQGWPRLRVGFMDLESAARLPGGVEVPFYDCPC